MSGPLRVRLVTITLGSTERADFRRWLATEHATAVAADTGIRSHQHFVRDGDGSAYLLAYEAAPGWTPPPGAALPGGGTPAGRQVLAGCTIGRQHLAEQILPGDRVGPSGAGAVLFIGMDVPPERTDEYMAWYNTEHIPRLSRVPGTLAARRFRSVAGAPGYLTLYHLAEPSVWRCDAWLEAAETPWTFRVRRWFANYHREFYLADPG